MTHEQTLILIKPDGIQKQLIGEIIKRFEESNLKVCALKMIWPNKELAEKHYPLDEKWAKGIFERAIKVAEIENRQLSHSNHLEFGKNIQEKLITYLTESPVIAIAIKGPNAIISVRKMVGLTEPCRASSGTIRGDFASEESYKIAELENRSIRNLLHASDSIENAKREISTWFEANEVHDY